VKARTAPRIHIVARRAVMTLDAALERVSRLLGARLDWSTLESFLPATEDPALRRSALASSFVAALELARLGKVELQQDAIFAPLYLKAAQSPAGGART
jgi:segregation and condensation protein A